jgi:hypothetical protein
MLFAYEDSEQENQRETKIPGEDPGIDEWHVIMRVKDEVGYYERTERGEKYGFARQISGAAKKESRDWGEIGPIGRCARKGVANPVKSDGKNKYQSR